MAVEIHARRLERSWQYDFKLAGRPRQREGGYRTKAEALVVGNRVYGELISGIHQVVFADAYKDYMAATTMADRSRDRAESLWLKIEPTLGHLFIEDIDTCVMDGLKQTLPRRFSAKTINHHLAVIRAVLRFTWKRGKLKALPYVPMDSVPRNHAEWYDQQERDRLLDEMYRSYPQWYAFFYLTCRLGLRRGEVYALTHDQVRFDRRQIVVDRAAQVGNKKKKRPALIVTRKNDEAYVLEVSDDVLDAIRWHNEQGYGGPTFLFSKDEHLPVYLDGYKKALAKVQKTLGLRALGHHAIGRHAVASQAATGGESIKAIQAQLGHRSEQSTHRYAHLGSKAQLRLIEGLKPACPPHAAQSRVNVVSTETKTAS